MSFGRVSTGKRRLVKLMVLRIDVASKTLDGWSWLSVPLPLSLPLPVVVGGGGGSGWSIYESL